MIISFPILYFNLEIIMKNTTMTNFEKHEVLINEAVDASLSLHGNMNKTIIEYVSNFKKVSIEEVLVKLRERAIDCVQYIINKDIDPLKNKHETRNMYYDKDANGYMYLNETGDIVDDVKFKNKVKDQCNTVINYAFRDKNMGFMETK